LEGSLLRSRSIFDPATIHKPLLVVLKGEGMSKLSTTLKVRSGADSDETAPSVAEKLLRTFNAMRDELVSTLWFILGNREDAQDTAQEAFLKCWRAQSSIHEVRDLRAWIFRVGLNAAKDLQRSAWYRRARLLSGEEIMISDHEIAPAQHLENQESLDRLRRAILNLRPDEQEVFLLRQNGELTYEQIAEIRQSPVGTVKTQMRSALQKLRQRLN
jgi:RNA polymerase sigma-70 factor (ECF subfamily)